MLLRDIYKESESEPLVAQLQNKERSNTHQALISKGIVNAPDEKPERPQVLKPEVQHKISQQNQCPNDQELQIQEGTARSREIRGIITNIMENLCKTFF